MINDHAAELQRDERGDREIIDRIRLNACKQRLQQLGQRRKLLKLADGLEIGRLEPVDEQRAGKAQQRIAQENGAQHQPEGHAAAEFELPVLPLPDRGVRLRRLGKRGPLRLKRLRLLRLRLSVALDERAALRADEDIIVHFFPAIITFLHCVFPSVHIYKFYFIVS